MRERGFDMVHTTADVLVLARDRVRPAKPPPIALTDPAAAAGLPCELSDPEMWFAESPVLLERAKELCSGCPARQACLAGALERREPAGVWGGEIFDAGRVVATKRGRGRPRKDAATPKAA
jgi:WhiB family redox-sensing transcriptional regulator